MQVTSVDEKVESVLTDLLQLPAGKINDGLAMTDVELWDSLKHMELIASLEESFKLQLTFDEIVSMRTVGEIKRVLRERSALN